MSTGEITFLLQCRDNGGATEAVIEVSVSATVIVHPFVRTMLCFCAIFAQQKLTF